MTRVHIIGAGLAGCEAAWQCSRRGIAVNLYEMRPVRSTPAHQTSDFAELVCSNSLKSDSENTAPWLLKEEMRRAGSLLIEIARECSVPRTGGGSRDVRLTSNECDFSRTFDQRVAGRGHASSR